MTFHHPNDKVLSRSLITTTQVNAQMQDLNQLTMSERDTEMIELAVGVVAAYVAHNSIGHADLPRLIAEVHATLKGLGQPIAAEVEVAKLTPPVSIRKSIAPDYIVCLEDGKRFKSLKRHLRTHYGLTPDAYREKWGLPQDYPMVAPNYAAARSQLAKQNGLGRRPAPPEPAKKRGRRKAA